MPKASYNLYVDNKYSAIPVLLWSMDSERMLVDPISFIIIFKSLFYYDVATCEFKSKRE